MRHALTVATPDAKNGLAKRRGQHGPAWSANGLVNSKRRFFEFLSAHAKAKGIKNATELCIKAKVGTATLADWKRSPSSMFMRDILERFASVLDVSVDDLIALAGGEGRRGPAPQHPKDSTRAAFTSANQNSDEVDPIGGGVQSVERPET